MFCFKTVSTHSRPKAAGKQNAANTGQNSGFNTQPPEGGWCTTLKDVYSDNKFQHTAARRRLAACLWGLVVFFRVSTHSRPKAAGSGATGNIGKVVKFQHTAARRRLVTRCDVAKDFYSVSTHSRPKAAGQGGSKGSDGKGVSTHSRPKAAGTPPDSCSCRPCFNTQPPEGGWFDAFWIQERQAVSTHSRPKAAGLLLKQPRRRLNVSTHSRPKAAGIS